MFDSVDPHQSFPTLERAILQYWREEDMFRRSIENREGRPEFGFYDGPPFATGLPHYGHLLAGTVKDVIPRYRTMRGNKVQRRFGWDCHGLPIENMIEKEEGIKSKQDIEAMGVARFNELCRASVQRYAKEWKATVERMGRWVDMDWDYKTMDAPFMESIWWVFRQLFDKELIYEAYKPMHVCPRCVTPLSNFEVTLGYKDVTDMSATVMFEIQESGVRSQSEKGKTCLLAWTTTPWTLPGNLFIAVGADVDYVNVEYNNDTYIVAENRAESVFKYKEYKVEGKPFKGKKLEGSRYTPLFPYYLKDYPDAFTVVTGDFVSTEEGTGLVHIAPGFGEDDFTVGQQIFGQTYRPLQHVTMEGQFTDAVTDFAGQDVKPKDDPSKTDQKIIAWLEKKHLLFSTESYRHSYPHCWRCDSPLLNYATSSWFVKVEQMREKMLKNNAETAWVPAHLRNGRFGNWLENARDWAISRNRYWGTPLPIWRTDDGAVTDVIGGRQELMNRSPLRFSKITVLRHGEAQHNVDHFYQSKAPGVDLTTQGKTQAGQAAAFLSQQSVDVIYCSPLARTQQTAQAIADATGAQIVIDERLREINVGDYEGKGFDNSNLTAVALKRQKKLQEGAPESVFHLEGMEKWTDVQKRAADFLQEILPRHRSDHVVIVTHADVVMNMRHFFTKEDPFKLSHTPYPDYAEPEQFYWDHDTAMQMDLHKHLVDDVRWTLPDAGPAVEASLIRHGQTDMNKERVVQGGDMDTPLNAEGREQAALLAQKLKKENFTCIVASDLKRSAETAKILAKELNLPKPVLMKGLRERNLGEWSGQKGVDVAVQLTGSTDLINLTMNYRTPKNGETLSQFIKRLTDAYDTITREYAGKKILIVSHRGVMQGLSAIADDLTYAEANALVIENASSLDLTMRPLLKHIPEVLDCWFESGSMPYAQPNFPYAYSAGQRARGPVVETFDSNVSTAADEPAAFPADFIAENLDQTRGWFYTLMVLSTALFDQPAFKNCICGGIVLAEDGRKMSKKLKNYPDPNEVMEKYGADALRFSLMNSPVVRAETLRFSERAVEETVQRVLLPLWNSYSFFVTYANLAKFEPVAKPRMSGHPLDRWIRAEVQDLVNRMTTQLDAYDLSATCDELFETIDALTNWYIRLSRRRFAGKAGSEVAEAEPENFEQDRADALTTLYDVLITVSQLLAPFCPFITEAMYLNLADGEHGSIHLTDWPLTRPLTEEEHALIAKNRLLRSAVSLGLTIRANKKIRVRTPLASATVALPVSLLDNMARSRPNPSEGDRGGGRRGTVGPSEDGRRSALTDDDMNILRQELNVKEIVLTDDLGSLGERYALVDARKVGPRLGKRVQEVIQAGKRGDFEVTEDGSIRILDEVLAPDEAQVLYRGAEGSEVAADAGVVVAMDTHVSDDLELEGLARDLIRAIQKLRKEQGYTVGEQIVIGLDAAVDHVLATHKALIEQETCVTIGRAKGKKHPVTVGDLEAQITLAPKPTHG